MIEILVTVYVVLVFIAYGMTIQCGEFNDGENGFVCSALFLWVLVPFLILITFGKWIVSVNDRLNEE